MVSVEDNGNFDFYQNDTVNAFEDYRQFALRQG